jgi:hypothetical protein
MVFSAQGPYSTMARNVMTRTDGNGIQVPDGHKERGQMQPADKVEGTVIVEPARLEAHEFSQYTPNQVTDAIQGSFEPESLKVAWCAVKARPVRRNRGKEALAEEGMCVSREKGF